MVSRFPVPGQNSRPLPMRSMLRRVSRERMTHRG